MNWRNVSDRILPESSRFTLRTSAPTIEFIKDKVGYLFICLCLEAFQYFQRQFATLISEGKLTQPWCDGMSHYREVKPLCSLTWGNIKPYPHLSPHFYTYRDREANPDPPVTVK